MEKLILEKLYWRVAKNPYQLDVVLVVNGKAYEYIVGNLRWWKLKEDLSDLHLYNKYEELDTFIAKYGQLEITAFRSHSSDRTSCILICDNLLLLSEFEFYTDKAMEDRLQTIDFYDDFRLDDHARICFEDTDMEGVTIE